jgi:predicted TPR repeat methyltransferase
MPNVYSFKDFEGSSHRILIDLINRYSNGARTLLDLGAAGGELGEALRSKFKRTIGFEYDVDRIGDLRHRFDQVVITDLENVRRLPNHPDAIVLADILEHLRDPRMLLQCVREALPPEGHVFVSVPNIANVTVRIGLLLGIFEYRERGILDSSHLRFYTMRAIRRDVEGAGFRIIAIRGSSVPIRLILPWAPELLLRVGERMLTVVTRIWRALFAYQIIIVARRDS